MGLITIFRSKSVLKRIRRSIFRGEVLSAMFGTPCTSFSVARDRTAIIRDRAHPWGKPNQLLSAEDAEKVRVGNLCALATLTIIQWLDRFKLPWCVENPHSSKLWQLPPFQELMSRAHVEDAVIDFCQYGSRWRKRTRLLFGNLDSTDIRRFEHRMCQGRGFCSRTGLPHQQLTGAGPGTLLAQPYPAGLCADLAMTLSSPYLLTDPSSQWFTSY